MPSPVKLASIISYALEQLRIQNRHHDFEHLCRFLTRERIISNVLPATGPVAGSGDHGRDFETFHTYLAGSLRYSKGFLGLAAADPVAFACTTQRDSVIQKIKSDVESICTQGTSVRRVYVFCIEPIKVAERHAMKEWAKRRFDVTIEIIDGLAIAEILSDREVFWIAQEYLLLPAELAPDSTADADATESATGGESQGGRSYRDSSRYKSVRQANSELGRAIDLMSAYSGRPLQETSRRDFSNALAADLRALHRLAGSPDLDVLSVKTGYEVQRIAAYMSGRHRIGRGHINALVSAIAEYARENGTCIPPHQLDMVAWERKTRVVRNSGMQKIVKNQTIGKISAAGEQSDG